MKKTLADYLGYTEKIQKILFRSWSRRKIMLCGTGFLLISSAYPCASSNSCDGVSPGFAEWPLRGVSVLCRYRDDFPSIGRGVSVLCRYRDDFPSIGRDIPQDILFLTIILVFLHHNDAWDTRCVITPASYFRVEPHSRTSEAIGLVSSF